MSDSVRSLFIDKLIENGFIDCYLGELQWYLKNYNLSEKQKVTLEKEIEKMKKV